MTINLGDKARDLVTGFEGICIARTKWLNGCVRCSLQSRGLDKEGKIGSQEVFDEPQLELIKSGVVPCGSPDTGGPIPKPTQHAAPTR